MPIDPLERFLHLVARSGPGVQLDEACLCVAARVDPSIDVDEELARLDRLSRAVGERTVEAVRHHLFATLGLSGDTATYGAIENSLLPRVLDRRQGIPITLSVLFVEIARRLGVPLVGVGMPGHFLVRSGNDPERFFDPFSGGVELDRDACRRLFAQLHGPDAPFREEFLDPSTHHDIIRRVLGNLRNACARVGDMRRLADVLRMQTSLPGSSTDDLQALVAVLERRGAFAEAADAARRAAASTEGERASELEAQSIHLRARLN